jgi:hypothetical protein
MKNLKDMVSTGKIVQFKYYLGGNLWYITECGFLFPVPTSDIGEAKFLAEDKAILFMRYIRQYIDEIDKESKSI